MKIYKMLLAVFLLISSSVVGQQDVFERAIDYCNCKLTFAYLNNYTSGMSESISEKKSFIKIKDSFGECNVNSSIEYSILSKLLTENDFENTKKNLSKKINDIKDKYVDSLYKDDATNLIIEGNFDNNEIKGITNSYKIFDELNQQLSKEINTHFDGKFRDKEIENFKANENIYNFKNESRSMQDLRPNSWVFNYVSLILLIITFVPILIIAFIKNRKFEVKLDGLQQSREGQRKEINEIKRVVDNLINSGNVKIVSSSKNNWQSEIEERIYETNKTVNKLINSFTMLQDNIEKGRNSVTSFGHQTREVNQQAKAEILYASIPSKDGSFNESAISNKINPTASFYKLTIIDTLGQKAKFVFLGNDERAVKDATNAPERILRPACKISNALNQNAKKIKTISPGTVIKQNGRWVIETLSEIEYE